MFLKGLNVVLCNIFFYYLLNNSDKFGEYNDGMKFRQFYLYVTFNLCQMQVVNYILCRTLPG